MRALQTNVVLFPFNPMRFTIKVGWQRYALGLALFVIALLVRFVLDGLMPGQIQFLTFFPAELITAFLCGPLPAVMVLILSGITGAFLLDPLHSLPLSTQLWGFLVFMVDGGMDIILIYYLMSALQRLNMREEQLLIVNRELKHRIKNIFSITNSICSQSIRDGLAAADIRKSLSGRILAIAAAQDQLSILATEGASVEQLVRKLVAPVSPEVTRLRISGAPVTLPQSASTPFALVLNELATNALKYGAWSAEKGYVAIDWKVNGVAKGGREFEFVWREHDGPPVTPAQRSGLGSVLINRSLSNAEVDHVLAPSGLQCRIKLPL